MRIITGTAKGRKIDAPEGMDTRPTLERVKESVFGSIQFDIYGRNVLDLFAGSGNLGIEALSRGAKHAVFCDNSRTCFGVINSNLKKLGFENATVYNIDYSALIQRMQREGQAFDLVFIDPPYSSGLAQDALCMLCDADILSDDAIVVAEHDEKQVLTPPQGLNTVSRKLYRATAVTIFRKNGGSL